jgi:hypothetical protein
VCARDRVVCVTFSRAQWPAGSQYHALAGLLSTNLTASFRGLFPFEIPFLKPSSTKDAVQRFWKL